jgi:thiamine biosynthesis lipoprotein ApbE
MREQKMRAAGNIYAVGVKPGRHNTRWGIRVRVDFFAELKQAIQLKAGTNKTSGEQPGWETRTGNG